MDKKKIKDIELVNLRLDQIIRHIDIIKNDIGDMSLEQFRENDLLARATCFSIVQIGEQMVKIEKMFGEDYPNFPWQQARDMRNLLVHVYHKTNFEIVYDTAINNLPPLKENILQIKEDVNK